MTVIFIILVILIIVQIVLILRKGNKMNHQENAARIQELKGYIDQGRLDLVDVYGRNILMIAASSHYFNAGDEPAFTEVIDYGIEAGMDVNAQSETGKTALHYALTESEYPKNSVSTLLGHGANPNTCDNKGKNALMYAVTADVDCYRLVAERTADVNYQKSDGVSALMIAARHMKMDVVHDLLARGANPRAINAEGLNAADIAEKYKGDHIRTLHYSNTEEGTHHDPTADEERRANEWNHKVNETVRKLRCLVDDQPYKEKKFKAHGIF